MYEYESQHIIVVFGGYVTHKSQLVNTQTKLRQLYQYLAQCYLTRYFIIVGHNENDDGSTAASALYVCFRLFGPEIKGYEHRTRTGPTESVTYRSKYRNIHIGMNASKAQHVRHT